LYEINTWVWLTELGGRTGRPIDLGSVPASEWDSIAALGFDAVWLMGVWERSPAGIAIANRNPKLLDDFRSALPDFRLDDNVGSPYCVRRYVVDLHLGGPRGLARAREELARRGLHLVLDFVPNHVAPDHPWVMDRPSYFIRGTPEDLERDPASFLQAHGIVYACGRDPYFPPWPDVLQLNAFDEGLRRAARRTLRDIAIQCDGVRCDMAMLFLNDVFTRTWGARAGLKPPTEYWADTIPSVKQAHPDFIFIGEAYCDRERDLQQHGFDFCYDKRLYDRLEHDGAESIGAHLSADLAYQARLVRFIENHDEPRAAAAFSPAKERAAAVVTSTLPGACLFHEGQLEGRARRLPVFLRRRPDEPGDPALRSFYEKLLATLHGTTWREGRWRLCERDGWPDNESYRNLVAWRWVNGDDRCLVVVNLSDAAVQGRVRIDWDDLAGRSWRLHDRLSGATYDRSGDELASAGLYVDLAPWSFHVLECRKGTNP
jgi:glycosidase